MKVVVLLGQRIRVGTNFIGSTLASHPDVSSLPPEVSRAEFNLFTTRAIEHHYHDVISRSFALGLNDEHFSLFVKEYFRAWLNHILHVYRMNDVSKTMFIKSPNIQNFDLWRLALPDAKIALLTRDGRDNVESAVRAANDKRQWHTLRKTMRKRLNYYSGRSFTQQCRDWNRTATIFQSINENELTQKFKYEELNDSFETIHKFLEFFDLRANEEIVDCCLRAPVVGSSWGINDGKSRKPNWKPDFDKARYRFSEKWTNWGRLKKHVFKKIAGRQLIELGYESSNQW